MNKMIMIGVITGMMALVAVGCNKATLTDDQKAKIVAAIKEKLPQGETKVYEWLDKQVADGKYTQTEVDLAKAVYQELKTKVAAKLDASAQPDTQTDTGKTE